MFSDDSPAEWRDPCKNHGNYPKRPQKSYLNSILTSEKRITLFPFPDILKPVHGYFFFRGCSCDKLFWGGFTLSQQIPF